MQRRDPQVGFTLLEMSVALVMSVILLGGIAAVTGQILQTELVVHQRTERLAQARFAMQRMTRAVTGSARLIVPLAEDPASEFSESVREQRVPPEAGREDESAVLAVTLAPTLDRDGDGIADADNDGDGRIDEDWGDDSSNDEANGIYLIDDDGDGSVDEASALPNQDDDERFGWVGEDPVNGMDDDGDRNVDEDPSADMNGDGQPGLAGVDDDEDGQIDEGAPEDDDEDGSSDEDWLDVVVFYLNGDELIERIPMPLDYSGDATISGRDYVEMTIAENVTYFRVERVPRGNGRSVLADITLELSASRGEIVSLNTRIRVGDSL